MCYRQRVIQWRGGSKISRGASVKFVAPNSYLDSCAPPPPPRKLVRVYTSSVVGTRDLEESGGMLFQKIAFKSS